MKVEIFLISVLVIILATVLLCFSYVAYGYVTQSETLVIEVTDKRIEATTTETCIMRNDNGVCLSYMTSTTYHYVVVTSNERFSTTHVLYGHLHISKRHHVVVRGWKGLRYIVEVVE